MKTIASLARDLAARAVTSRALTEEALRRIEAPDGEGSKTFIRIFRDAAIASADSSDRLRAAGVVPSPLAGIPISVKDLCDVAGVTTLGGSRSREGEAPARRDAAVVHRLRAAGAVVIGTTNMSEFALGALGLNPHYGNCRNPWDRKTGRAPGGSSSGAAVSVTDGMAAGAIGSDTMGSIRHPAGLCGLAGFKPTASRVSRRGVLPLSTTLDSLGPLAWSVECCALLDGVIADEPPEHPEATPLAHARLGVPKTLLLDGLEEPVARAFERAISALSAAGARIDEFEFPEARLVEEANRTRNLSALECYAIHRDWFAAHHEAMDPRVTDRVKRIGELDPRDYYEALRLRAEAVERSARTTARFDAVIMPTLPVIAPPIAEFTGSDQALRANHPILIRNTCVANYLDRCALTVPCHETGSAPVGFMLMGARLADRAILGLGMSVESRIGTYR